MPIRLLVRHIRPGDRVVICGQPETVARIACSGSQIDLYVLGSSVPHSFSDSDLIGRLRSVPVPPARKAA
ncbi:hypothetical protein ACIPXV_09320 [Streptomyces libani]|uniref:hypothetical protein n=1 Tax=Streptomyces nigrescens TaxID=1920 RepID=UPI0038299332